MDDKKPSALTGGELDVVLQRLPGWSVQDFIDSLTVVNRLVPFLS
jgi:hypothetical protein